MRAWLLVALAACSSDDERCVASKITVETNGILSGEKLAGISWTRVLDVRTFEPHGHVLSQSGLSSDVAVPAGSAGVTGNETLLWRGRERCGDKDVFEVTLQRDDQVQRIGIYPTVVSHAATFDGTRYQLFWIDETNQIRHRSLDEDGTVGPVHDLGVAPNNVCVQASSDRGGTTFARWGMTGSVIDTETGDRRPIYSNLRTDGPSFYFAGKFHVREGDHLVSFSATATSPSTDIRFDGLQVATMYLPTATRLFVRTTDNLIELDTSFQRVASQPAELRTFGVIGDELVTLRRITADVATRTPGRVVLERETAAAVELAVDSPIVEDPESFCSN